jgi:hypothetical protein
LPKERLTEEANAALGRIEKNDRREKALNTEYFLFNLHKSPFALTPTWSKANALFVDAPFQDEAIAMQRSSGKWVGLWAAIFILGQVGPAPGRIARLADRGGVISGWAQSF